jgi:hypothetical protein
VLPVDELVALVKDGRIAPHPLTVAAVRTGSRRGTVPLPGSGLRSTRADVSEVLAAAAEDEAGGDGDPKPPASAGGPRRRRERGGAREDEVGTGGAADEDGAEEEEEEEAVDAFDGVSGPVAAALKARLRELRAAARAAP